MGLITENRYRPRKQRENAKRLMIPHVDVERVSGEQARANELGVIEMGHRAGGIVVPSTDVGPTPCPGFSLHRELSLHSRGGIPNADVLQNATRVAAEQLRHGDELGTIEAGKLADLLIIDCDPLTDIDATRAITTVNKGGVAYDPEEVLGRIETE